jgi:hypothetical protein
MRRLAPRLLTLLALMRVVPSSDGRAAVCAVGLAAGMGGDDTHSRDSSIPVSTHLRIRCVRGTAGARLTHLSSMVRTRGRRIHSQRICAHSTTGTAAVSNLHTALHARLLDSCSCASLTIGLGAHSFIACRLQRECVAEAAQSAMGNFFTLWFTASNKSTRLPTLSVTEYSMLSRMVLFSWLADYCWRRTNGSGCASADGTFVHGCT